MFRKQTMPSQVTLLTGTDRQTDVINYNNTVLQCYTAAAAVKCSSSCVSTNSCV